MQGLASRIPAVCARGGPAKKLLIAAATVTAIAVSTAFALAGPGAAGAPLSDAVSAEIAPNVTESLTGNSLSDEASPADAAIEIPAISISPARAQIRKGTPPIPPTALNDLNIPSTALVAYQRAADVMRRADETCGLSWTLLAAIGRVESNHGRAGGAQLKPDGTSTPAIRGVALNGKGPVAKIRDTDDGELDGDTKWDRAVGPMQFLPSTWSVVGVDADGDSVRSPDSIADAALGAAVFLCSVPGDLTTQDGLRAALFRYNPSRSYVADIITIEQSYETGNFYLPARYDQSDWVTVPARPSSPSLGGLPGPTQQDDTREIRAVIKQPGKPSQQHAAPPTENQHPEPAEPADPKPEPTTDPDPAPELEPTMDPDPAPAPEPTQDPVPEPDVEPEPVPEPDVEPDPVPEPDVEPDPEPEPTQDPEPQPEPDPVKLTGVLTACDAGWCLDKLRLDVGDAGFLGRLALADFDSDGAVASNNAELTSLAGTKLQLLVASDIAPALVLALNGRAYVERQR